MLFPKQIKEIYRLARLNNISDEITHAILKIVISTQNKYIDEVM